MDPPAGVVVRVSGGACAEYKGAASAQGKCLVDIAAFHLAVRFKDRTGGLSRQVPAPPPQG